MLRRFIRLNEVVLTLETFKTKNIVVS